MNSNAPPLLISSKCLAKAIFSIVEFNLDCHETKMSISHCYLLQWLIIFLTFMQLGSHPPSQSSSHLMFSVLLHPPPSKAKELEAFYLQSPSHCPTFTDLHPFPFLGFCATTKEPPILCPSFFESLFFSNIYLVPAAIFSISKHCSLSLSIANFYLSYWDFHALKNCHLWCVHQWHKRVPCMFAFTMSSWHSKVCSWVIFVFCAFF